jgi:WD40 repeat protein/DNA-binding SARP family transcriptional activator
MEFRILGPLEVLDEEQRRVRLPGPKTRALLAELLINANQVVSVDRLVEAVWGEDAPDTAAKTLQTYVLQVRKAVEPGRAPGTTGEILLTRGSGYLLAVQPKQVDAFRFERLVEEGRDALSASEPERAAAALAAGLALWRGPALADVAGGSLAQPEAIRLEELRLAALEDRIEADLAVGRRELVGELEQLVARHPLRERLWGQLMVALYRSGRQADALRVFQRARAVLIEELGIDPGPELRRLEAAVLAQDPALDLHVGGTGFDLPAALDLSSGVFAGRAAQMATLMSAWDRATGGHGGLVFVAGPMGIGKTRLVAEVAARAHAAGALVLYGRAVGPTSPLHPFGQALEGIGCSIASVLSGNGDGSPAQFGAELNRFLRRRGSGRPVLLALDDLDRADDASLEALAAMADACSSSRLLVLATLGSDDGTVRSLSLPEGANVVRVPPLAREEVAAIAAHYLGPEAAEPAATLLAAATAAPLVVHREAARMARSLASRRIGEASERAVEARVDLRDVQRQIAGGVLELQRLRAEPALKSVDADEPLFPEAPRSTEACPYKGLARFEASDVVYFFGREQLAAELVARVVGASVLAVIGPSGSGKSSLVRAGLLPALRDGLVPGADRWAQVIMTPGPHPGRELVRRLVGRETDGVDAGSLSDAVDGACAGLPTGGGLVLFVDQFEEVFTACRDASEREAFLDALVGASNRAEGAVTVVVTIRSDYYGHFAAHQELADLLAANQVLVGAMSANELRRAIELPAQRAGLKLEPNLAEAMVADVADEPGALPLLSTALLEAWEHRRGRTLESAGYHQRGGVRGAVARLAESAYAELTPAQQEPARRLLLRLADVGEGDAVVRRRVTVPQLVGDDPEAASVLVTLTNRRLLTSHDGMVEVAHEALLREWPRLCAWLEDDVQGRRLHQHLQRAANDWDNSGREPSELYRGPRLVAALDWSASSRDELSDVELAFLDESAAAAEREATESRRRTEQQALANRRLRLLVSGLAVVLIVALLAGGVALVQRRNASHQALLAESRAVAAQAVVENSLDRSLLLAREASNLDDSADTRSSLLASLVRSPQALRVLRSGGDRLQTVALSPDGRYLAAPDNYGKTFLWDTTTFERLDPPLAVSDFTASGVAFTPDSRSLLTSAGIRNKTEGQGEIVFWDLETRTPIQHLDNGFFQFAGRIELSGDGRWLVAAGPQEVAVWDLKAEGRPRFTLPGRPATWRHIVVGDDGGLVAVAHSDGSVLIWDARSRALLHQLEGFPGGIALSPDAATLAVSARSGTISLVDTATGTVRRTLAGHTDLLWGLDFSADGTTLASGGDDRTAIVWDVAGGTRRETLRGHTGRLLNVAWSPDSRRLYTGGLDGTVMAWQLSGDRRLGDRVAPPAGINVLPGVAGAQAWTRGIPPLAVSPDGSLQAIGDIGGTVILRRLPGGEQVGRPMKATRSGPVVRMAFSPDGSRLAMPGADGDTTVWDVATQTELVRLAGGHPAGFFADPWPQPGRGAVVTAAWSPDGRLVATGGTDGRVVLWESSTGEPTGEALRASVGDGNPGLYPGSVNEVVFSPDGRWLVAAVGAGGRGEVVAWSWPSRTLRHRFDADTRQAYAVAVAPDSRTVASIGNDGKVRFFDLRTGKPLSGFLEGHGGPTTSAAFSPDGSILATAGSDGSPILWDVRTQKQLGAPLPGPSQGTRMHAAFTGDGRRLIAQYFDGQTWVWDIDPSSWRDRACSIAGRNLTHDEWKKYLPDRAYRRSCEQWPAAT